MPYVAFEESPPGSEDQHVVPAMEPGVKTTSTIENNQAGDSVKFVLEEETEAIPYPVVKLDTDRITDATAGRLASSLLGHVLFLKNQVPFPVLQLGRIPGGKTNTRAFKQRTELLNSYDTITSHFDTTFSALSTAFARSSSQTQRKVAQAFLVFLIGPSIGTAKSKVFLGIDSLETRVWGTREGPQVSHTEDSESDDDDDVSDDGINEDGDEGGEDAQDSGNESGEDPVGPEDSDNEGDEEGSEDDEDDGEDTSDSKGSSDDSRLSAATHTTRAEELKFLQNADRLLSRTLAAADVDNKGISSEMSPSQTHVVIRAPRRFTHPAWIPRQDITTSLDAALNEFLSGSGLMTSSLDLDTSRKPIKKQRVEGVWITPSTGIQRPCFSDSVNITAQGHTDSKGQGEDEEMIWWSWDGKLVGFADW